MPMKLFGRIVNNCGLDPFLAAFKAEIKKSNKTPGDYQKHLRSQHFKSLPFLLQNFINHV